MNLAVNSNLMNSLADRNAAPGFEKPSFDPKISVRDYVALSFIPDHVEQKGFSGRVHYQSMLKHILMPETVEELFGHTEAQARPRLKAIAEWPYLDNVPIADVAQEHVARLIAAATAHGYSSQTVRHIRNVLGAVVSHAKRNQVFKGENPVSSVQTPPLHRRETPQLTIASAKAMLGMMQSPEREIALLTMTTGMSISEICGLQWKHINLSNRIVECGSHRIPPSSILIAQHWNPEGIVALAPNRIRAMEIPAPLSRALAALKLKAGHAAPDSFVLTSSSGEPLRPPSIRVLRLKPIGRKLGMPWISWQALTRAHTVLLSEMKVQLSRDLISSLR